MRSRRAQKIKESVIYVELSHIIPRNSVSGERFKGYQARVAFQDIQGRQKPQYHDFGAPTMNGLAKKVVDGGIIIPPDTPLRSIHTLEAMYLYDVAARSPITSSELLLFEQEYFRQAQERFGKRTRVQKSLVQIPKYLVR